MPGPVVTTRNRWVFVALCGAVSAVASLALQPATVLPGDPVTVRAEARHLVEHGELGIPMADRGELPAAMFPPHAARGQYMFENEERQKLFSRWGAVSTLLLVPPLLFADPGDAASLLRALNVYNTAWLVLAVVGLAWVLRREGASGFSAGLLLLAVFAGTHVAFYARGQSTEIIQLALLVLVAVLWNPRGGSPAWETLLLNVVLAMLFWLKVYFLPLHLLVAWHAWKSPRPTRALMVGGLLSSLLVKGGLQWWEFGSPLALGIGPPDPQHPEGYVALANIPAGLWEYLAGVHGSLVLHAPITLVALLGMRGLWKQQRELAALVLLSTVCPLAASVVTNNPLGEWSLGPRFLVPAVALLSLPALRAIAEGKRLAHALLLACLLVGGITQWQVARHAPFAFHQLSGMVERDLHLRGDDFRYFAETPKPLVMAHLHTFCTEQGGPLADLLAPHILALPDDERTRFVNNLRGLCVPNFLWSALR